MLSTPLNPIWSPSYLDKLACYLKYHIMMFYLSRGAASSAKICTLESLFTVTVPLLTKYLCEASSSYTVTTPGFRAASVGTCCAIIPKSPDREGTSTCKQNNVGVCVLEERKILWS